MDGVKSVQSMFDAKAYWAGEEARQAYNKTVQQKEMERWAKEALSPKNAELFIKRYALRSS